MKKRGKFLSFAFLVLLVAATAVVAIGCAGKTKPDPDPAAGEKPKPSESGEYTVYCFATIGITPSNSKLFHQHWCTNMTGSPLPIVS